MWYKRFCFRTKHLCGYANANVDGDTYPNSNSYGYAHARTKFDAYTYNASDTYSDDAADFCDRYTDSDKYNRARPDEHACAYTSAYG
jgi:hypothetical protein